MIYYAHPVSTYGTATEFDDVTRIATSLGAVINPNTPEHHAGYEACKAASGDGMVYFYDEVLPLCAACVVRAFDDEMIGAGVWGEAEWFATRGLPVYEIGERIELLTLDPVRRLSVDETRLRLVAAHPACGRSAPGAGGV
jgi:hypothetical protein